MFALGVRGFDSYGISTTKLVLTLRNCGLNKRMHFKKRKIRSTKMNRSHVSRQSLPETEPDPTTEGDEYLDKVSSFRFTEYFTVPIGRVRDSTEVFTRTIGEEYVITTTHRFAEKILAALEGIGVSDMEEIDE